MANASAHPNKGPVYWDYWAEMVKASVYRDTRELPAIIRATQLTGKHVVDVGCGVGRLILPFSPLTKTITAVDESQFTVKTVRDLIFEHRLKDRVQIVQSTLSSLPFDDDVSESTYCLWVIHYAKPRWEKIVAEMVRVTKKGAPVVVGFGSGEGDLPAFEEICKPDRVMLMKEFDDIFPAWVKEQEWKLEMQKVPLQFEFKSPEWALEVFRNTFIPKDLSQEKVNESLAFLQSRVKGNKVIITQELRLYVIRAVE